MTKLLSLFGVIIILLVVALTMISLKPSNQECIFAVRGNTGNELNDIIQQATINKYTIRIEDHIFYKNIYTATGTKLGVAILGTVIKK